jgi:Rod binding domain-containing protein
MEGVFLGILMRAMRSTVSSGALFGESSAGQTYREMFDQEITNAMAKAGGIGLAEIVVRDQLLRVSREAGRDAVRGTGSPDSGAQDSSNAPVRNPTSGEKDASVFDASDRYPD